MSEGLNLPPNGGWIAAAIVTLGALLKGAWPWLYKRSARAHELTAGERAAQREEERDLIATLKAGQEQQRDEIAELKKEIRDLRAALLPAHVTIASQAEQIKAKDAEIERLHRDLARVRAARDSFRDIAEQGERFARQRGLGYAETLACEISEADEATSQQRKAAK